MSFLRSRATPFADIADYMLDVLEHRRRPITAQDAIQTRQKNQHESDVRLAEKLGVQLVACDFGGPAMVILICRDGHRWRVFRKRNGSWPPGWLYCRRCHPQQDQGFV